MKLKTLMLLCLYTLTILVAINVFASRSNKRPAGSKTAASESQGSPPGTPTTPQIKWNMSTEQISQQVDKMIAAVNKSNPIDRVKQTAFTRALSDVRNAVVKNEMPAYQKAVTVLAGVSTNLSDKEQSQLSQVLRPTTGGLSSSCSISCLFGSCSARCSGGVGNGAACLCIWGWPQCACGGGGPAT